MKQIVLLVFLLLSAAGASGQRIRCGTSVPYVDSTGNIWQGDTGSSGGSTQVTTHAISGTPDQPLFQTSHFVLFPAALVYSFALPNGNYSVTVNLAEITFSSAGARVFSIFMQGTNVFPNVDIFKDVGAFSADSKTASVSVVDGTLTLRMVPTVSNAKCSSIAIIPQASPKFVALVSSSITLDAVAPTKPCNGISEQLDTSDDVAAVWTSNHKGLTSDLAEHVPESDSLTTTSVYNGFVADTSSTGDSVGISFSVTFPESCFLVVTGNVVVCTIQNP